MHTTGLPRPPCEQDLPRGGFANNPHEALAAFSLMLPPGHDTHAATSVRDWRAKSTNTLAALSLSQPGRQ